MARKCEIASHRTLAMTGYDEVGIDDIRYLDIVALREQLSHDGMELDPHKHKPFAPEVTPKPEDAA